MNQLAKEVNYMPASLSIIDNVNVQQVQDTMQKIAQFQKVVQKTLKPKHDFGIIPGTDKPTLLKPGAEKVLMLMGLTSEYDIVEKVQDYENGFFAFTVKCTIYRGDMKITEGLGHANTRESRYTNRWVTESKLPAGIDKSTLQTREKESKFKPGETYTEYLITNTDSFTLANTVLKMAKKRAQVDAVLTVASLSEIFTQDLEDLDPVLDGPQVYQNNKRQQDAPKPTTNGSDNLTEPQRKKIFSMISDMGLPEENLGGILMERYQVDDVSKLTKKQASDFISFLGEYQKKITQEAGEFFASEVAEGK